VHRSAPGDELLLASPDPVLRRRWAYRGGALILRDKLVPPDGLGALTMQ
jgi:hypothetical protein